MARMTGAQAVARALAAEGVEAVFGIPGLHSLSLYDALADQPRIRNVVARHELGAGFMADGYARASGRPGVLLTTHGPGAFNAMNAMLTAYNDSVPLLHITTQVPRGHLDRDRGALHETRDELGAFRGVAAWVARAGSPREAAELVQRAFTRFRTGRPRPIFIEVPIDVLEEEGEAEIHPPAAVARPAGPRDLVARAAAMLQAAERPAIWVGGGVVSSGAGELVARLAERLQAPVLTTVMGKGALPADHPLLLGGIAVEPPVREWLPTCDAMLVIGSEFGQRDTADWSLPLPRRLAQIDIDPAEIGKVFPVEVGIVGDAAATVELMLEDTLAATPHRSRGDRAAEVASLRAACDARVRPRAGAALATLEAIRAALPRHSILSNDACLLTLWGRRLFPVYEPRTFFYPIGSSTLGTGLPMGIGARIAAPDRPVVVLAGDGGFQFTAQELGTAVQEQLDLTIVIFDDRGYGALRSPQQRRFGRYTAVDLRNPDFAALARAYGAKSEQVALGDLGVALRRALGEPGVKLLAVDAAFPYP